jgi:hypothetical protein
MVSPEAVLGIAPMEDTRSGPPDGGIHAPKDVEQEAPTPLCDYADRWMRGIFEF